MDTLAYAEKNKSNAALIDEILNKARERKGLTHREAAVLLDCDIEEKNQEMYALAEQIKKDFYGNRIVISRHCTSPIIASMAVPTALITERIRPLPEKS